MLLASCLSGVPCSHAHNRQVTRGVWLVVATPMTLLRALGSKGGALQLVLALWGGSATSKAVAL